MSERVRAATPDDGVFMRRALVLAQRGWGQTAPNPMVGAVVVRDGVVVGEGWHTRYGAPHAEVEALRAAGEAARGATVYVTLEPCNHHGQTPPCTEALIAAAVAEVVVATPDPNPEAQGGANRLSEAGIGVLFGVGEREAQELNAAFLQAFRSDRSFVQLKVALSLDGALSDHTRARGWLTGPEARREVHRLRAGADGVAIGIGTARSDDPELTVRDVEAPRVAPARIVFDTSAQLPLTSRLVRTARDVRTIVVCWAPDPAHAAALEHAGVTLVHAPSLADALVALRFNEGIHSLLVEGGAALGTSFLQDNLVDRLIIFRAPLILGRDALGAFSGFPSTTIGAAPRWQLVDARRFGDDEMTVYSPRS
jgi:diaminohydroxyphosphoribosylaminopyrimidine deaminase/5-amino-6-(5-phosphoribosylamino)uracil reductase